MKEKNLSTIRIVFYDEGAQGTSQLGGGQLARLDLMKRLDPKIFTPILFTSQENELAFAARKKNIQVQVAPILDDNFHRFPREKLFKNPFLFLKTVTQVLKASRRLVMIIKQLNADIIHPNENLSRTITVFSQFWYKIPSITHIDGEWNKGLTDIILRKLFYYRFNYLIAVSKRVKKIVDINKSKKVSLINTGRDHLKYQKTNTINTNIRNELNIDSQTLVIATVGKLTKIKGQHIALQALAKSKQTYILSDFVYILVGDGPDKSKLSNLVKKLGLEQQVYFLGQRTDVPNIMSGVDCMIQPSLTEAFPLVLVESLMAECYIIASDVGGAAEILNNGKYGALINPGDLWPIIKAIKTFLEMDPEMKAKIIKEGQKHAIENYSIEKSVKKTEQLYLSLYHQKHKVS